MYREIYHTRRLVEEHAKDILRLSEGETIVATYADHDAGDRATMHRYGVHTRPARKDVRPGIEAMYERLQPDAVTGRPRMYFLRSALVDEDPALGAGGDRRPRRTEEELQAYRYPTGSTARNAKEAPVGVDDHGCDAVRYFCLSWERRRPVGQPFQRRDVVRRRDVGARGDVRQVPEENADP